MSKYYTQFDWASDKLARTEWAESEDRLMNGIDRSMKRKPRKNNKKNHREYA